MDERERSLAALRVSLALCEANPDLPVPPVGEVCLLIDDDDAGRVEVERIARALRSAGLTPSVVDGGDGSVYVVGGNYRAFYVSRSRMADHNAHMSYVDNVCSDAAPAGSVAA